MYRMTRNKKFRLLIAALTLGIIAVFTLSACTSSGTSGTGQDKDRRSNQGNYNKQVAQQPAHTMAYSPTRDTINFWIDTWGKKGQKAYVYLQNAEGKLIGYYVLAGPPVSMCTALTPTYAFANPGGSGDHPNTVVPAPSVDGAYYSGGECNTYYGKDASSGAYIEYTVGLGINVLLYNQPLTNHPGVENLSPTS